PHDGRLAGAVGPEQGEHLALGDGEVDAVENDLASVRFAKASGRYRYARCSIGHAEHRPTLPLGQCQAPFATSKIGPVRRSKAAWSCQRGGSDEVPEEEQKQVGKDERAGLSRGGVKAAVCTAYGPPEVLQIRTVPDPRPRDKEVCIRLFATAVTASDCIVRSEEH